MVSALLVEDDDGVRELISDALTRVGWRVMAVESADEAIGAATTERFDVVLCDVFLPDINGFELSDRLRACQLAPAPIVFMTGYPPDYVRERFGRQADDLPILQKPFSTTSLIARLRSLAVPRPAESLPLFRML